MANGNGRVSLRDRIKEGTDKLWNSQVAESIMRPGSPFKEGRPPSAAPVEKKSPYGRPLVRGR